MWVFTTDGFISCVRQGGRVAVRARERDTLEALARIELELGRIEETTDTDYRYRTHLRPAEFTSFMALLASELDYPNFKSAVLERQGRSAYEKALHAVWSVMARTQPGGPYSGLPHVRIEP
jgi:hypothetical protein